MFKVFSQHLQLTASTDGHQNPKTNMKNMIMLKQHHSQWFIGVCHMIWITQPGIQALSICFLGLLKFSVSLRLWYCMEMRHFNGKWKPCELTAVMRRVWGVGLSLGVWFIRGGVVWFGATQERGTLNKSALCGVYGMTCSKMLSVLKALREEDTSSS